MCDSKQYGGGGGGGGARGSLLTMPHDKFCRKKKKLREGAQLLLGWKTAS